jgi:GNAT superfamily N-acetyltransferase
VLIREATAADAALLAPLMAEFNEEPSLTAEQMLNRMRAGQATERALLAFVADEAVGFCVVRIMAWLSADHPYAELTELFVRPAMRRQGIAAALMERAQALATEAGAKDLILLTGFWNEGAQAFYRSVGYADYCLAMRRKLDPQ